VSTPALALFDDKPPPDWVVRGFEAALGDKGAVSGAVTKFGALTRFVPDGDRADAAIRELLPLLGNPDVNIRDSAAQALGTLAAKDPSGSAIEKILSLLGDTDPQFGLLPDPRGTTTQECPSTSCWTRFTIRIPTCRPQRF
jgi:hypothetical protein